MRSPSNPAWLNQRFAAEGGRGLVVCCPAGQVEKLLRITGLIDNGLVFETVKEAVAAVDGGPAGSAS